MEFVVLGLLMLKEMTIYELNASFKQGLSLIYSASLGSLQHAVKKLTSNGLIGCSEVVENGRNKKIYSINEDGMRHFMEWIYAETPLNKLETVVQSKVFFLGLIESNNDRIKIVEEMLQKVSGVENSLIDYKEELDTIELPPDYRVLASFQFRTLEYGIMAHRTAVEWLEGLLTDLQEG